MGVLGGDWVDDNANDTSYELHTDIDVTFTMSGQTDTGLTFGASIDLDESDGDGREGASSAFDNRDQGGEEIFISGAFGTLTMGDTDGALDWALQEIGIGDSLGDAHTSHSGYSGNDFTDGYNSGQIARYDHSFGDFALAISANIDDDASGENILAVGAKYNASLAAMELGLGVGYSQLGHDGEENEAVGVSLDAEFKNGFRAILNWVDMGDVNTFLPVGVAEQYIGVGLGYAVEDWIIAANLGEYSEEIPNEDDRSQRGYALAVNYDLGGGAEVQLGYASTYCKRNIGFNNRPYNDYVLTGTADCTDDGEGYSRISLGLAMSF